ncbi:MAG: zf-TFIIB domain-containing protein [Bacteroidetes bacterium]|nr:zf-TFIIB domain-containing protein [Bacteroidota bacterium]
MRCPNCNVSLVMSERNKVEIDYCPECRGVWLDRGELDKIIERSNQNIPHYDSYNEKKSHHSENSHYYKKKKGFLDDLFDF